MFIHPKFKEELKKINPIILEENNMQDIDNMPNEIIWDRLITLVQKPSLDYFMITNEANNREYIKHIIMCAKAVDDEYIWPDIEKWNNLLSRNGSSNYRPEELLIKWTGFSTIVNSNLSLPNDDPEAFPIGKIVRVCASNKLKNLNMYRTFATYMKKYFKIESYEKKPEWDNIIMFDFNASKFKPVWCSDVYGNIYCFPQGILLPTTVKDLNEKEKLLAIEKLKEHLLDVKKYDLGLLTDTYQDKLREFMEISKSLYQKQTYDVSKEAERLYEISLNMKEFLLRNEQIDTVDYVPGVSLEVHTKPLWCDNKPIGKYKIQINLMSRDVKAFNVDIKDVSKIQHPHVNTGGKCCLGDYTLSLQSAYKQGDYVTLVNGMIEFLESIYPQSVFISMERFQSENKSKFKYQLGEQETAEVVDLIEPSHRFAVGDFVQIINNSQGGHPIGTIGRITDILTEGYVIEKNGFSFVHSFDYVTFVLTPYAIGTMVEIINEDEGGHLTGTIGEIVGVIRDDDIVSPEPKYQIYANDTAYWHHHQFLSVNPHTHG